MPPSVWLLVGLVESRVFGAVYRTVKIPHSQTPGTRLPWHMLFLDSGSLVPRRRTASQKTEIASPQRHRASPPFRDAQRFAGDAHRRNQPASLTEHWVASERLAADKTCLVPCVLRQFSWSAGVPPRARLRLHCNAASALAFPADYSRHRTRHGPRRPACSCVALFHPVPPCLSTCVLPTVLMCPLSET